MALVITGAKALIKISGEFFAFATGVSVTQENRLEEIPQLDNLEVAEYAENGHRCTISISSIKLASDASPQGGTLANSGNDFNIDFDVNKKTNPSKNGDIKQILLQPEMIIEIVEDRDDGEEVTTYIGYGAKFEGGTGQLDARGVWNGNWNFKCRRGVGI